MTSNFIYFYIYSYLRAALVKRSNKASSGGSKTTASAMLLITEELMIGFLSGVVSKGITTPLSVITVQLQSEEEQDNTGALHQEKHGQSEDVPTSRTSLARVVRRVYSDGGLSGFFKGMSATVILSANPALTMLFLQAFRRIFLRGKDREQPTGAQGFLGGALSNSLALLILYPLVLSKARLQSYSKEGAKHPTLFAVVKDVVNKHGVAALYQGLLAQILKGFFNQGVTIMVKQRIEKGLIQLYHYTL